MTRNELINQSLKEFRMMKYLLKYYTKNDVAHHPVHMHGMAASIHTGTYLDTGSKPIQVHISLPTT